MDFNNLFWREHIGGLLWSLCFLRSIFGFSRFSHFVYEKEKPVGFFCDRTKAFFQFVEGIEEGANSLILWVRCILGDNRCWNHSTVRSGIVLRTLWYTQASNKSCSAISVQQVFCNNLYILCLSLVKYIWYFFICLLYKFV